MRAIRDQGWRSIFAALTAAERRNVREILAEDYAAEIRMARQLAEHANRLSRYPDRRARLLEIAAREEEHARWLREAIERLGGRSPERVPSPPDARTDWERLVTDLELEKEALEKLLDDAYAVERDHPEIAALLLRIREEEVAHQREIAWILSRSQRAVLDRPSLDVLTRSTLRVAARTYAFWSLGRLEQHLGVSLSRLPVSLRVLLENLLRHADGWSVTEEQVEALARWSPFEGSGREIVFYPTRLLLYDCGGVPVLVDLGALRAAARERGADPSPVTARVAADLVGANAFGTRTTRIVHELDLACIARVVFVEPAAGGELAYPDTIVGTDSRTARVNALGVLGWGVGGFEAAAAVAGRPVPFSVPQVVGVRVIGRLEEGVTATDLVHALAARLGAQNMVGKFVEFCGPGLSSLEAASRAAVATMASDHGATVAFFPIDAVTLDYLRLTGRDEAQVALVEAYAIKQGLFRTDETPEPLYSSLATLDLGSVAP